MIPEKERLEAILSFLTWSGKDVGRPCQPEPVGRRPRCYPERPASVALDDLSDRNRDQAGQMTN